MLFLALALGLAAVLTFVLVDCEASAFRLDLLGCERFRLLWICRSADLLIGYLPELSSTMSRLRTSLYGPRDVSDGPRVVSLESEGSDSLKVSEKAAALNVARR